ncbi:MAG TPA: PAS domain S-box protein, partial [Flavisolibacter sp.]|nr:PAS domain S-box protein [Flavisolibacter sp.]
KHFEQKQQFVLKLSDVLYALHDAVEILSACAHATMNYLKADRCYYVEIDGDNLIIRRDAFREDLFSTAGIYSVTELPVFRTFFFTDEPIVISNVAQNEMLDESLQKLCIDLQIIAFMSLPVVKDGKLVGRFCLAQCTQRDWKEVEIELAKETAERTWAAVQRANAEEALRINEARMAGLKEAYQSVVNEATLVQSLNILSRLVLTETSGDARTAFFIADKTGTSLYTIRGAGNMSDGYADEIDGLLIGEDSLACGLAVLTGQPVVTPDVYEEPRWKSWTFIADKYNYRSCWSFPIKTSDDKAVGTFAMYFKEPRQATANDLALARMVTQAAAVIISSNTEKQQRAEAEEALRQSEVKFRSLSESGIVAIVFFDIEGPIVDANDAFLDMMGVTREDLNSEKVRWDVYTPKEWMPRTLQAIEEFRQTGHIRPYEKQFYRSNGELRWGLFAGAALGDEKTGVSLIVDITERKEAEERLKDFALMMEQEVGLRTEELQRTNADLENFKRITDSAHDSIISLDRNGHVTYWNHASEVLYGYSQEEVVHGQLAEFVIPEHKLAELALAEETVFKKGEAIIDMETQRITKEGKLIDVLISIFPLKDDNNIIGSCGIAKDITDRKKWEEEIRKNLTILQHTEQLAQTGSWEYDVDTGDFSCSPGLYKLFGLPQQMKVRPEIFLDSALEEDRSIAKRIVNNLKKKHRHFEEVMKIKRGSEERLLRIKASVVYDEEKRVRKIIGVDMDITDIQKAEERLKESQHWLEQTTKASPDAITIYDLQKKQPVYLNNCLSAWTGINNHDLIEMGVEGRLQLIHPDDRLDLLHHNEKTAAAKDGEVLTIEYRIKSDDDKVIWLRNRSKPFLRDSSGKVTHILSVLQNVTREVELREQLKQRTQFAEAILDASVDRITVFDQNYRFVSWNKRCEQIHHKTKEEVIGKTIFEMFPGIENHPEYMNGQELSLKGQFIHVPMVRDGFTGDYLELFYIPLKNAAGETYAVVNIMHDVSDYVINTEQLNALNRRLESKNVELEQKNEEITSFAFVASHDMKEPLRKIHTFSDWLLEQEMDQLSSKGKSLVEKIGVSVHRMEILIEDILVLTKIHSDTHREEDVDLNNILNQVIDDMTEEIVETGAEINKNELPAIKANSNQVFYLFKNLISNAIKFQKVGNIPQVTVTSEIVDGREVKVNEAREEYLKLSFADNGFGFDQRYEKKIFQVFQRLHGKHEFEGTGIGLAICKKIMENHGGTITVLSEPGKGSVFSCFFPLS